VTVTDAPANLTGEIGADALDALVTGAGTAASRSHQRCTAASIALFRLSFVGGLERPLNFDCTMNGIKDAREFGQHTIAGCVCDPTSMPPNEVVDHGAMHNVASVASSSPCIRRL
jgi:hypothetical protein